MKVFRFEEDCERIRYSVQFKSKRHVVNNRILQLKVVTYYKNLPEGIKNCKESNWHMTKFILDGKELNISKIYAGMYYDNNISGFMHYYNTLIRMRFELDEKGCKQPYTIISDMETYKAIFLESHIRDIAIDYAPFDNVETIVRNFVVSELDYIITRPFIRNWVIDERIKEYSWEHRIMMTDNLKEAIISGNLRIYE